MEQLISLLPLIGILLLFWLMIVAPARRRQREHKALQAALGIGDEVMLTSGIFGVVRAVGETRLRVAVSDGVEIEVAKGAVASIEVPAHRPQEPGDA